MPVSWISIFRICWKQEWQVFLFPKIDYLEKTGIGLDGFGDSWLEICQSTLNLLILFLSDIVTVFPCLFFVSSVIRKKIMHLIRFSFHLVLCLESLTCKPVRIFSVFSTIWQMNFCCPVTKSSLSRCGPMGYSMPASSVLYYLLEFAQIHVYWVVDAIQRSHPLLLPSLPALNLSQHQGLSQWVDTSHQVIKVWSFSFSISPSNEYSGFISFRIDWFDLLAVQGALKGPL